MTFLELMAQLKLNKDDYEKGLTDAKSSAETKGSGITGALGKVASGVGKTVAAAAKVTAAAVGAAATGVATLTTAAIKNYAEYEQLVGGIETLFGAGGKSLEQYADSVGKTASEVEGEYNNLIDAQNQMLTNASNAYKTAGLSANDYMNQAINMSAAMVNSLDGDTKAAADKVDLAITDMSDNVNKMGTSMEAVQNAYTGFAKGNYTMLDNLALGYSGTKEGMESLIEKAEELDSSFEAQRDESGALAMSYADIVDAIHIVQTDMGITGTTAKEASTTISGSLNQMKSAWTNLVTGLADDNADINSLMNNLVETLVGKTEVSTNGVKTHVNGFIDNIIPVIENALTSIGDLIQRLVPKALEILPTLITNVLPKITAAATSLVQGLVTAMSSNMSTVSSVITMIVDAIVTLLPDIISLGGQIIDTLVTAILDNIDALTASAVDIILKISTAIIENLPELVDAALQIIVTLASGISEALPELVPTIVDVTLQIVQTLLDNMPLLVEAAGQLLQGLTTGLINAIPTMTAQAPQIASSLATAITSSASVIMEVGVQLITSLVEGLLDSLPSIIDAGTETYMAFVTSLSEGVSQMVEVGKNLLQGLWNGISSKKDWIIGQVKSIGASITSAVKSVLGINSPSKVFAEIGNNLVLGLEQGWEDNIDSAKKNITSDLDFDSSFTTNTKAVTMGSGGASSSFGSRNEYKFYVNNILDGKSIGESCFTFTTDKLNGQQRALAVAQGGYY